MIYARLVMPQIHKYKIDPLPADTGEAIPVMSSSSDEDESWQ